MRSFVGPNTVNFKPSEEKAMTEANVDTYLEMAKPETEEAKKACDAYIEEHFGVYGSEGFKVNEYNKFVEEVIIKKTEMDTAENGEDGNNSSVESNDTVEAEPVSE